mgnify:CR=1 FL=1
MKKLYIIDGMSIVFRAYHAMQNANLRSPSGEPTSALFAFANIITNFFEKNNPDYVVVAFDREEPTFRHQLYPLYKANRDAFPEDLIPQLKRIKQFLELLNVKIIEIPGFEADDIIGTLSKKAANMGFEVACITSDKDFYQLVDERIKLYKPAKNIIEDFDIIDYQGVIKKFGVEPQKVIDILAIIGDSSDNVPGIKGIGEKTAIPLVLKYGSLEGIYKHLDSIASDSLKEKFEQNKEIAFLSKQLVTIETNVNLNLSIEELKREMPNYTGLDHFFSEIGFNSLRKKYLEKSLKDLGSEANQNLDIYKMKNSGFDTISSIKREYKLIDNYKDFEELITELQNLKLISVDLETSSLDRDNCEIVGIAIAVAEGKSYYIAVNDNNAENNNIKNENQNYYDESLFDTDNKQPYLPDNKIKEQNTYVSLPIKYVCNALKQIFENKKIEKCGQNLKFDAYILKRYGINLTPIIFDSMIASYLLDPDEQHNLDALSKKWLSYEPIPITNLIGEKKANQKSMKDIPPRDILEYAAEDADLALKLRNVLIQELKKQDMLELAEKVEFPLIEVLTRMEYNGVAIDSQALKEISDKIAIEAQELTKKIYLEAQTEFNLDSTKQLAEVLFDKMQIPPVKKTKTGYSTDVEVLSQLSVSYPIASYLLDYRQLMKLKSTYIDALPRLVNPKTGRIHTTFNQTIVSTGRLSSTDPNLQNIPIRTSLGKEIRRAFVPQYNDTVILSADYSQIELRIMAFISQDSALIEAFKNNYDIHSATASKLFDIQADKVNPDLRRIAKTVNFGIMYGLGSFGLSQRLGISRTEATRIIEDYYKKYPGIKRYINDTIEKTREKGYAETILGRKRYFKDINSKNNNLRTAAERAAINMPIQGTASDMMKIAMINIDAEMQKRHFRSMMTIQVHDELVFEVYKDELSELKEIINDKMIHSLSLGEVPVIVDIGIGNNWFEAH